MRKNLLTVILLALVLAPAALAATPYIGASYGPSKTQCKGFQDGVAPLGLTATCDVSDNGYRIYGGMELTPMWGVELGYQNAGEGKADAFKNGAYVLTLTAPLRVWDALLTARREISRDVQVGAHAGVAHWNYEVKASNNAFGAKNNENTLTWGVGAEWKWITLGYDQIRGVGQGNLLNPSAPEIKQTVKRWSVGLKYRFGR